uniref:cilia- and flagella-associated protein 97 isoform X2 n=1 Tax=Scatophagus argus TaxID=75038 RepID=UPI001ED8313B|nr:cilia- and flagella-associated protein 97 isoform X2 [Scatophagus argus]
MFNPSDLEGEVDHSFFDSDCDDSSISRDGGKKMEKCLKTEKENQIAHERLHAKETENSGRTSASSVACTSEKVISNRSDSEEDSNLHSGRPTGTFMALLTEPRQVDHQDAYSQTPNESDEEALPSSAKNLGSKGRNNQSPKKRTRNRCTRSPSPTSSESSVDADSEGSCSSGNRRRSLDSLTLPGPSRSSLSPGMSRIRVDSAGSRDSDDTVTDVSPLSSSDASPLQSFGLNHKEAEEGNHKEPQQQESVPSSGLSNIHQDEDLDHDVNECTLSSESQLGDQLVFHCPGGRNRKNYSFTNDEVRSIDCENQRLLRELSRLSSGSRPRSTARKTTRVANNSPLIRISHSALNRQREQQRIERENLAFLKRLESVKATPGIKRSEQLADYQRQVGYLRAPSYPLSVSATKKGRSASKTPSGPRSGSSAQQSSRAVSTTSDSSSASMPRSKKPSAARPAWC